MTNLAIDVNSLYAGGLFTPGVLSGLVGWWRADKGITLDGSNTVQQWNDLSPNGFNLAQGIIAERPGYSSSGGANNQARLIFTSTLGLQNASATLFTPGHARTIWSVLRRTAAGSLCTFSSQNPDLEIQVLRGSGGTGIASDQVTYTDTTTYTPDTNPHLFEWDYVSGSPLLFFVDNISQTVAGGNAAPESAHAGFGIGSLFIGTSFAGDLEEIVIVDHLSTNSERNLMHAYSVSRYATA